MQLQQALLRSIAKNASVRSTIFRNAGVTSVARSFHTSQPANEQSPDAESELLREQRKRRPVSPHLSIYQPQITWYLSAAHRVTGSAIGGAFYLGALGYLAAPAFGYTIDAASMVSTVAAASVATKVLAKSVLAFPFVFHSVNGVRHLVWDACKFIDIKDVYKTGYGVLATTVVGALYLISL